MSFNFIVLVFCGFLSVNLVQSETYTFDKATGILAVATKNCTEFGPLCSSCSQLSYCLETSDGNWIMQDIVTCGEKETCNSALLQCSTETNYECDASTRPGFVCHGVGLFPDPYDCTKYHLCVPEKETEPSTPKTNSIVMSCPTGYAYDIVSSSCRINLALNKCPAAIACKNVTTKAFEKNPSFYYMCLKTGTDYYPQVFVCPKGQHLIGNKCQDPPTGILSSGLCMNTGLYYDPSNCRSYNECNGVNILPNKRTCPTQQYFSYASQKCVDYSCDSFLGK